MLIYQLSVNFDDDRNNPKQGNWVTGELKPRDI